MAITVSLMSNKKGELKKFWEQFEGYHQVDEDVVEWIYIYNKPEDAADIIKDVMKEKENFEISLWVQVGDDDLVSVNEFNHQRIIKGVYLHLNQNTGLNIE